MLNKILKDIQAHRNPKKAKLLAGFFKTGQGQYGEGDIFWGLTVPVSRTLAMKYRDITLKEIQALLKNKVHEVRLIGILVLVHRYKSFAIAQDDFAKSEIVEFYLQNTKYINNWDLVDLSASRILGDYLVNKKNKNI